MTRSGGFGGSATRARAVACACGAILGCLALAAPASAATTVLTGSRFVAPDVQRLSYRYGPVVATAGTNLNLVGPVTVEKPSWDGYVTRFKPDLVYADGQPPRVDVVHMHHAVFVNLSRSDVTAPSLPQRFGGFGEEKTIASIPAGYGYPLKATDAIAVNYMVHNGTTDDQTVFITYEVDYVAADSALGATIKPARPLWLDVENGKNYPVYDVKKGTGGDGRYTYPNEARPDPYGSGPRRNEWVVDRDGTLVVTAGHLHPGGLWTDLDVVRGDRSAHVFRSEAKYFDPNGPVSWDLAMTATPDDWRVGVRKGDRLRVSAAYETERASWYESMGLMLAYIADDQGPDPFEDPPPTRGEPTHGQLPEATNYGGKETGLPDPRRLPDGATVGDGVGIGDFAYLPGDLSAPGDLARPPVVARGGSLRFGNLDSAAGIWHTVTACAAPCNRSTGVSYPLADGPVEFDSGQLGYGLIPGYQAAAERSDWFTPTSLEPGTYTYFCRVHPFMRGSFRVSGTASRPPGEGAPGGSGARSTVSLASRRLRLGRRGVVSVRLRCGAGSGSCRGRLTLSRVVRRGPGGRARLVRLGAARFDLAAGSTGRARVRLSRRALRLLARRARVRVAVTLAPDGGASSRTVATLRG